MAGLHTHNKYFSVEAKESIVRTYLWGCISQNKVARLYNIHLYTFSNWYKSYKCGGIRVGSVVALRHSVPLEAHRVPLKDKTIEVNGKVWVEYKVPSEVLNIDGVDYIQGV